MPGNKRIDQLSKIRCIGQRAWRVSLLSHTGWDKLCSIRIAEENWLPIERTDYGIGPILRIYAPDLQKLENWKPPAAEQVN